MCVMEKDMSIAENEIIRLNNELERAAFCYHVLAAPVLEDEVYDKLYHNLVDLESKHPEYKIEGGITSRVGFLPIESLKKVKHA